MPRQMLDRAIGRFPLAHALRRRAAGASGVLRVKIGTIAARAVARSIAYARATTSVEVAEAVLGVAMIVVASLLIPGQWGFLGWEPHPLWIVVLAIAIRYAAPAGYIASILAAISEVVLLWLRPGARFNPIPEHNLVTPFLFVVVGVLISRAVQSRRQRLRELEQQMTEADRKVQSATDAYLAMRTTKLELEKQIIGQPTSIAALSRIAKCLESLRVSDLYPAVLGLVERFLECQACALYLMENGELRLRVGAPDALSERRALWSLDEGLVGQALRERRVVTVRDRLLQSGPIVLSDETALMAGPLVDPDGEVTGIVVIERLPFVKFTPATVSLFTIILDWASTALANATTHERTRARLIEDEATGAFTATHMLRSIHEHLHRVRRYRIPVSVVVVRIADAAAVTPTARAEIPRRLIATMRRRLRAADIIGHHPDPDTFILILPMTGRGKARVAAARIIRDVQALGIRPYGTDRLLAIRLTIIALSQATETPEDVLSRAAVQLARTPPRIVQDDANDAPTATPPMRLPTHERALDVAGSDD